MNRIFIAWLMIASLGLLGCERDNELGPESPDLGRTDFVDPAVVARQLTELAGWEVVAAAAGVDGADKLDATCILDFRREVLVGNIVHYSVRVPVGPGPYDRIGLHRVVRETSPGHPVHSPDNLFLLHGDWKNFEGCFLPGLHAQHIPIDFGFAVYLAQAGVDVWGIDQPWSLVPPEVTDFGFMANWGMQKHVDWTNIGVEVARLVRLLTGNGYGKMALSGYSGGSALGFAVINQDAGLPQRLQRFDAYIGIEQGVRTDDPAFDQANCEMAGTYQSLIDAGQFQDNVVLAMFGIPARDNPSGPSDLMPGLTNFQAALTLGTMSVVPGFPTHFFAGIFDQDGIPTGFQYADPAHWIDFLCFGPAYQAAAFERDEYLWCCSSAGDVPWDDNFHRVRIPVLYLAAGGGFAPYALHTLDLLGSSDKTSLIVSLNPDDPALDFGHIDTFLAADAPTLTWQPMLAWLQGHRRAAAPEAVSVSALE